MSPLLHVVSSTVAGRGEASPAPCSPRRRSVGESSTFGWRRRGMTARTLPACPTTYNVGHPEARRGRRCRPSVTVANHTRIANADDGRGGWGLVTGAGGRVRVPGRPAAAVAAAVSGATPVAGRRRRSTRRDHGRAPSSSLLPSPPQALAVRDSPMTTTARGVTVPPAISPSCTDGHRAFRRA